MQQTKMEDSEKLINLKKVYADIILNTAKEAAARVMVSERKALRFQQELVSTKDEALRMLLRLKQMMDSKVNVAEMVSLNQQKKIDELEAQLEEAEEIVSDLRAKLKETQAVLDKVTNNKMHSLVTQNIEERNVAQEYSVPGLPVATNDSRNPSVYGTNDSCEFCASHDHINNCYINNPDFASIVIRRKEHKLYQNRCTQRICAVKRNLFMGTVVDHVENRTLARVGEGKAVPVTTDPKADTICETDKPDEVRATNEVADHVNVSIHSKEEEGHRIRLQPTLLSEQVKETNKASKFSCPEGSSNELDTNDPTRENSSMVCANEARKDLGSPFPKKDEIFLEACSSRNNVKDDQELLDKSDLTRQESLSTESSDVSASRADVETAKELSDKLDPKASVLDEKGSSQSVNGKFLKYTFQRKRKREPISCVPGPGVDCSLENTTLKKNCGEKQNDRVEPVRSCTMVESTQDSRRLAQLANK